MRGEILVARRAVELPQPRHQIDPMPSHRQIGKNPVVADVPFIGDALTVRAQADGHLGNQREAPKLFTAVKGLFHHLKLGQIQQRRERRQFNIHIHARSSLINASSSYPDRW